MERTLQGRRRGDTSWSTWRFASGEDQRLCATATPSTTISGGEALTERKGKDWVLSSAAARRVERAAGFFWSGDKRRQLLTQNGSLPWSRPA